MSEYPGGRWRRGRYDGLVLESGTLALGARFAARIAHATVQRVRPPTA